MLTQRPPPQIQKQLDSWEIGQSQRLLCTNTDIDPLGRYRAQWLVATADEVIVLSEDDPLRPLHRIHFSEAGEFRCHSVVGSGLLQARINGTYIDLLRYSNRLADRFEKVARKLDRALRGEPIVIHPQEQQDRRTEGPVDVQGRAILTRMWAMMRPYRGAAAGMMALLLAGIALDVVSPQLTRILVDHVLPGNPQIARQLQHDPAQFGQQLRLLMMVVAVLACVQMLRMLVNIINGRLSSKVGTQITFDMRSRIVDHLQKLSVSYYDRQQVGSLVGRVVYDTEALHGLINQFTGGFLFQLIMILSVGVMMFSIDARIAFYALLPSPLVILGSIVFWRYIYPRHYKYWDSSSKQAGMLSGMLSGIRVVKAFSQETREMQRFERVSGTLRDARRNVDMGVASFNPIMSLVFQLGGWIVWYVGGRGVLQGQLTLGELMAFFGYLWMFYGPLATLTQLTNWITQFLTQTHRIFEVLDAPVQILEPQQPRPVEKINGQITFDHVYFGYFRHNPVLRDVSLTIDAGEMVGVVGRSGSGKSTIVNLICRFYDVDEGRVMIDTIDVRDLAKNDLRRNIGVVLQDPFLFRGSIWDNLTYGRVDASVEQVLEAAKAGNCHDFIMHKPHAYDTWVGERGAGLSGGERQRISIARVLLTDPRILILDEATSSVDAESEAAIQKALAQVVQGRTTIAIAHRISTLRLARRIVVVDDGKIAEMGPHDELMAKDGIYARLVKLQGVTRPAAGDTSPSPAGESPAPPALKPRWLDPQSARIHLGDRSALHVTIRDERIYGGVYVVPSLPVHAPSQYLSLRYLDSQKRELEIGLIRRLDDWPPDAQKLLRQSLLKRYFVHTIAGIENITSLPGFLCFQAHTDLGPMNFTLRAQSDRVQDHGTTGKMLLDLDDNRYLIPDVQRLPQRDRELFQRYVYW